MSGLFFKYDMSALKVRVIQERDSIPQFLLRISSIICGIYVCSGKCSELLRRFCSFRSRNVTCQTGLQGDDFTGKPHLLWMDVNHLYLCFRGIKRHHQAYPWLGITDNKQTKTQREIENFSWNCCAGTRWSPSFRGYHPRRTRR